MKIAIASQNRRQVTGHTGRCRRYWIYDVVNGTVIGKELLDLAKEQCFHESPPGAAHPLDGIDVLISGGMGQGLVRRLAAMGIRGLVTTETDPDRAVELHLAGSLPMAEPEAHAGHGSALGGRHGRPDR